MKKVGFLLLSLVMACTGAMAQEEIRFDITGFEGLDWDWMYTGNSVVYSQIEWSDFAGDAPLREGEQMLAVEYDNEVGGTWQGVNLSFPEPVNLTGATEIHMWVFVVPERTVGNFEIRLDLPDGTGLGTRGISSDRWGEWVVLVWKMDRVTSADRISSVGSFGGFISAGDPP
ncbi:MAG: hypothetical protein RBU29_16385, partial [bacterium]|nr:hypothetical protein [bacterium]